MADIRLVLTDLDDTMVEHMQHTVSDVNRQAVIAVEERGIRVAAISGRAYKHAKDTLNVLGIDGLCILDGGATIVQSTTGDVVWKKWLDAEKIRQVLAVLKRHCHEAYFTSTSDMVVLSEVEINDINEDAAAIYAVTDDAHKFALISEELSEITDIALFMSAHDSHPDTGETLPGIHIMHANADKFHGAEALRGILHIQKSNTLAIGNGDNDLPLFRNAELKIAVGNATESLKREADYIVASYDNDGFAEAMYRFVL